MKDPDRPMMSLGPDGQPTLGAYYYRCKWFDQETRKCTNYENRPPMCRDYPWHGRPPTEWKALPKTCGFLWDLDVEPEPIPVSIR
jgi:Fe-S-cluster containining protein